MNPGGRIRVLIVDDSAFMRKVLLSILTSDPQFEVVGEARDGREAVSLAESTKPDVITMDINMPHMDGLQATEIIMSSNPRPILIVSSESREGADITLKALELGAIEFVAKPSSGIDLDMNTVREELMRKLKMAAKVRVVRTATRSHLQKEVASSAPRTRTDISTACKSAGQRGSTNGRFHPHRYPLGSTEFYVRRREDKREVPYHRGRGIHGRPGDADEVRSHVPGKLSWSCIAGPAHAGQLHRAIQRTASRGIQDQGEGSFAGRDVAA